MMRKATLLIVGALFGALATAAAMQPQFFAGAEANAAASDTYRELNLFGDVFERVRADYVEVPDDHQLIESAINGMLSGLDPHSSYMNPKDFQDMQVQTSGKFGGLGIEVTSRTASSRWSRRSTERRPSKAGILANDEIVAHRRRQTFRASA